MECLFCVCRSHFEVLAVQGLKQHQLMGGAKVWTGADICDSKEFLFKSMMQVLPGSFRHHFPQIKYQRRGKKSFGQGTVDISRDWANESASIRAGLHLVYSSKMRAAGFFVRRQRRHVTLSVSPGLRLAVISARWLRESTCWVTCNMQISDSVLKSLTTIHSYAQLRHREAGICWTLWHNLWSQKSLHVVFLFLFSKQQSEFLGLKLTGLNWPLSKFRWKLCTPLLKACFYSPLPRKVCKNVFACDSVFIFFNNSKINRWIHHQLILVFELTHMAATPNWTL